MQLNVLDWILLGLLAVAAVRGWARGLVRELLSVAAPIAGIAAAVFLRTWAAGILGAKFGLTFAPEAVAAVLLFLVAFALVKLLASFLHQGLEAANLDRVDKVLGLLLGLIEGLVVISAIILIIKIQPVWDAKGLLAKSAISQAMLPVIAPELEKALHSLDMMGKQAGAAVQPVAKPKP